jgi:hypothetical protein
MDDMQSADVEDWRLGMSIFIIDMKKYSKGEHAEMIGMHKQ